MRASKVRALLAEIDAGDVALVLAVLLLTVTLWPSVGRLALLVPGSVALWLALPTRAVFIEKPMVEKGKARDAR